MKLMGNNNNNYYYYCYYYEDYVIGQNTCYHGAVWYCAYNDITSIMGQIKVINVL